MSLTKKHFIAAQALLLSSFALSAHATPAQFVVAPNCLAKQAGISNFIASHKQLVLIKTDETGMAKLSDAKHQTKTPCGGFINVTEKWQTHSLKTQDSQAFLAKFATSPAKRRSAKRYAIQYKNQVNELINKINPQLMWDNLTKFSSSKDRYANSDLGVEAANWLKSQVETIAKKAGRNDVSVRMVKTGDSYDQPSVVAKLGNGDGPGVVIGAHMDTTASYWSNKPGADDDGSGSMTTLETARTIISSGKTFNKPIYFIWYAAEEEGLVGSSYVVEDFKSKNIPIDAVLHFDMTGYAHRNDPTIWLMNDNVDSGLTAFLEQIVTTYTGQPVKYTRCGYACSDHASWDREGFAAALPAEARFEDSNPTAHSSSDTIDKLSITHMTDYAKIGTAFVVELAEPTE